jgi:hypothetical protein
MSIEIVYEKRGPGKFEDSVDEWVYDTIQEGGFDDILSDDVGGDSIALVTAPESVWVSGDAPIDKMEFQGAILFENMQGMVSVDYFETVGEANQAWQEMSKEWELSGI